MAILFRCYRFTEILSRELGTSGIDFTEGINKFVFSLLALRVEVKCRLSFWLTFMMRILRIRRERMKVSIGRNALRIFSFKVS